MSTELLTRRIALACSPEQAFSAFTRHIDLWWPRGHRRTREASLILEARPGGRLIERAPDGSEWIMGRIAAFEPAQHLAFDWFPGSPAAPTSVDVSFRSFADGCEIEIVHRAVSEGARQIWPQRIALFEKGWDTVLPALKAWAENTSMGE